SGKRKGGDCHVRMALGQRGFTVLLHPLFFLNLFESFSINLLNCKHRTGLAKVAVQCSANTFVVNQNLVLRINIFAENRHLRQARKRYTQPISDIPFNK
ncbi:MAG: hypothetical protein Q7U77_05645, partial [Sediminibacterium sp.]|uniref:hypothetical protein n=1 Tax=Sediminibacterium sp. TaxID=1917865 RepID=UPI00271B6840